MSLIPLSREHMRSLKSQKDEENRIKLLTECITYIYKHAVQTAEKTSETRYQYIIEYTQKNMAKKNIDKLAISNDFIRANITDVQSGLQSLFPGCLVEHTILTRGHDGKMYDILKMDKKVLQFINVAQTEECIVIDWS